MIFEIFFENFREIDLNMKEDSKSLTLPAVDVWYYVCSSDKSFFPNSENSKSIQYFSIISMKETRASLADPAM